MKKSSNVLSLFSLLFIVACSKNIPNKALFETNSNLDTLSLHTIIGKVQFPNKKFSIKATLVEIGSNATVSVIYPSDNSTFANQTIATGLTDTNGNFKINPDANFTPTTNDIFVLEASKRLGSSGNDLMSVRTYIKWTGEAWTSITTPNININAQTTAITILDDKNNTITPNDTIGKIDVSQQPNVISSIGTVTATNITDLESTINLDLTNSRDPVQNSNPIQTPTPTPSPSPQIIGEVILRTNYSKNFNLPKLYYYNGSLDMIFQEGLDLKKINLSLAKSPRQFGLDTFIDSNTNEFGISNLGTGFYNDWAFGPSVTYINTLSNGPRYTATGSISPKLVETTSKNLFYLGQSDHFLRVAKITDEINWNILFKQITSNYVYAFDALENSDGNITVFISTSDGLDKLEIDVEGNILSSIKLTTQVFSGGISIKRTVSGEIVGVGLQKTNNNNQVFFFNKFGSIIQVPRSTTEDIYDLSFNISDNKAFVTFQSGTTLFGRFLDFEGISISTEKIIKTSSGGVFSQSLAFADSRFFISYIIPYSIAIKTFSDITMEEL